MGGNIATWEERAIKANYSICEKQGHIFPGWINPTCTLAGNSERTCTNCNVKQTRTTGYQVLGHLGSTPPYEATCTTTGNSETTGTCTRAGCGQIVNGTVVPALGHQGLLPAYDETCTTAGNSSLSGSCKREGCGQVFPGTILPALGHQGLTPPYEATCTTTGNSELSGTCTRAGCWQIVNGTVVPALGHQGSTPPYEANCTSTGNSELSGTCTRADCGQVIHGMVLPALGHDSLWKVTNVIYPAKSTGTCTRCDFVNPELRSTQIGDTGPAGGKIFYIDETGFNVPGYTEGTGETEYLNYTGYTAYYLEAAPSNVAGTKTWASTFVLIPGLSQNSSDQTDWVIGRGRRNTAIIIAHGNNYTTPYTTPAASECKSLATGGRTDWFLPSKNKLNQIYLRRNDLGIASSGYFWSSSQYDNVYAWNQNFFNGNQYFGTKDSNYGVRAIRVF